MLHTSLARRKKMAFLSDDNDFEDDDDYYTEEHIPLWPIIVIYILVLLLTELTIFVFNS